MRELASRTIEQLNALHAPGAAFPELEDVPAMLGPGFASAQRALGVPWDVVPGRPKRSILDSYFNWAAVDGMTDPFSRRW